MTSIKILNVENDIDKIIASQTSIFQEEEEGRVGLKLYAETAETDLTVMIRRSDSRDNFQTWVDIKKIDIIDDVNAFPIVYDYTIESGIWYKYGIQKYEELNDGTISRGP